MLSFNKQKWEKKIHYLYANETITYDSGNLVSPQSNKLFYAWEEVGIALKQSSHDSWEIPHVENIMEFGRCRQ